MIQGEKVLNDQFFSSLMKTAESITDRKYPKLIFSVQNP